MLSSSLARPLALALALGVALPACGDDDAAPPGVDAGPADAAPDLAVPRCMADIDCSDGTFCNGRERCAPAAAGADSHGCVDGPAACGADPCDEAGATCPLGCPDADGDGVMSADCGGTDCDDADAMRFPGNPEVCDAAGVDDDCNASTLGIDADSDGFISSACCNMAPGGLVCGFDCDDAQSGVNPGSPEACNGIDDDCDGLTDERLDGSSMLIDCYADADGDGFAPTVAPVPACACGSGLTATAPLTDVTIDCDDVDASQHPGAPELCNYADDDCNAAVDDGVPRPTGAVITRPDAFMMRMTGSAEVNVRMPFTRQARLTVYNLASDRGAAWYGTPLHVGYGTFRVVAHALANASSGPAEPFGGWAVVLAQPDAAASDLGPTGDALGVPTDRSGLAIEWRFSGDAVDTITVVRIRPAYRAVLAGPVAVDPAMQLTTNQVVEQNLVIEYTPEDPLTAGDEETLVVRNVLGGIPLITLAPGPTTGFRNELAAGDAYEVGFTAANGPPGAASIFVTADPSSMESYIERSAVCF